MADASSKALRVCSINAQKRILTLEIEAIEMAEISFEAFSNFLRDKMWRVEERGAGSLR